MKTYIWEPAPEPSTKLGRYRLLSPTAGIRVSPLVLGGMSLGEQWSGFMGKMDSQSSFNLLDAYFDAGGNFIDTANVYQGGDSERLIGEWMEKRDIRDQVIVATKYSTGYTTEDKNIKQHVNYLGNNAKSLHVSIDASLKKLRTSYIDIMYVHWWDHDTSVEEVMDALHRVVLQGKVLYLGVSDTPAWVVSKANTYARSHGKTPFSLYQGAWSIMQRDFEREVIPMARAEGMALVPWNVIAGGRLRSDAEEKKREESGETGRSMMGQDWKRNEDERKVSAALEKVGQEVGGASISAVAIAYVMHKSPYVFPMMGGRKVEHLQENIKALSISLSRAQIQYLESILPFSLGFPHNLIGSSTSDSPNPFMLLGAVTDKVPVVQPISHTM